MKKNEYKQIIDNTILMIINMTEATAANKSLDPAIRLTQKATAVAIMDTLQGYIQKESNDNIKAVANNYSELFKLYKEDGTIQSVDNTQEYIKKLQENENDNSPAE